MFSPVTSDVQCRGGTATHLGIAAGQSDIVAHNDAARGHVMVIITDGAPNSMLDAANAASAAKLAGTTVVTVSSPAHSPLVLARCQHEYGLCGWLPAIFFPEASVSVLLSRTELLAMSLCFCALQIGIVGASMANLDEMASPGVCTGSRSCTAVTGLPFATLPANYCPLCPMSFLLADVNLLNQLFASITQVIVLSDVSLTDHAFC